MFNYIALQLNCLYTSFPVMKKKVLLIDSFIIINSLINKSKIPVSAHINFNRGSALRKKALIVSSQVRGFLKRRCTTFLNLKKN